MAEPWENDPVVADAEPWEKDAAADSSPATASISGEARPSIMDAVSGAVADSFAPPESYTDALLSYPSPGTQLAIGQGVLKSIGDTLAGMGNFWNAAGSTIGINERTPEAFQAARDAMAPDNPGEDLGFATGQAAQFAAIPGPSKSAVVTRGARALEVGANSALAAAQGASTEGAVASGLLSAVPTGAIIAKVGEKAKELAPALVRSAIKPTVAALKRMTGKPGEMLEERATRLAQYILDNNLATPQQALVMMREAANRTTLALRTKNAPTDAAERALLYLENLKKQALRQARPQRDIEAIERAAREMLDGPMGRDGVVGQTKRMVDTGLVDASGKPIMQEVVEDVVGRLPRTDIMADEALRLARGGNKLRVSGRAYGIQDAVEQADTRADKAIIRAQRDAAKDAVPEIRKSQKAYGRAKEARGVLDRMTQRQGNREPVSLPAGIFAANGQMVLAYASNWLRNNGMKAGFKARNLARAIEKGAPSEVAFHLKQLGVALPVAITGEPARASISGRAR